MFQSPEGNKLFLVKYAIPSPSMAIRLKEPRNKVQLQWF